jgi:hypothetical protein
LEDVFQEDRRRQEPNPRIIKHSADGCLRGAEGLTDLSRRRMQLFLEKSENWVA